MWSIVEFLGATASTQSLTEAIVKAAESEPDRRVCDAVDRFEKHLQDKAMSPAEYEAKLQRVAGKMLTKAPGIDVARVARYAPKLGRAIRLAQAAQSTPQITLVLKHEDSHRAADTLVIAQQKLLAAEKKVAELEAMATAKMAAVEASALETSEVVSQLEQQAIAFSSEIQGIIESKHALFTKLNATQMHRFTTGGCVFTVSSAALQRHAPSYLTTLANGGFEAHQDGRGAFSVNNITADELRDLCHFFETEELTGTFSHLGKRAGALAAQYGSSMLVEALSPPVDDSLQRAEAARVRAIQHTPVGFVFIEAGEFTIGSPTDEPGRDISEGRRRVSLTRSFWYQATPTTQAQWQALMGNNPSFHQTDGPGHELASQRPVERVNWYEAAAYCNALSMQEGLAPYYVMGGLRGTPGTEDFKPPHFKRPWGVAVNPDGIDSYRLPSEAEQQRACRGSDPSTASRANYAPQGVTLGEIAWYESNAENRTHPVGQLLPTNEGVYDGLGNVSEWCNDVYKWGAWLLQPSDAGGALIDPEGANDGTMRACGGASFSSPEYSVRAARHGGQQATAFYTNLGFRPARLVFSDAGRVEASS